jgi:hypothetical protein
VADRPTRADVLAYREEHECGLQESKAVLFRQYRSARLREIRNRASELYTVEACNDVIRELLDLLVEMDEHDG